MPKPLPEVTKEDVIKGLENPLIDALEAEGINTAYLTNKLQQELNAKETIFAKFQGAIMDQVDVIDWNIRQKARQDAHKLRGDYPVEKLTLTHDLTEHTKKLLEKIDGESRTTLPSEEELD